MRTELIATVHCSRSNNLDHRYCLASAEFRMGLDEVDPPEFDRLAIAHFQRLGWRNQRGSHVCPLVDMDITTPATHDADGPRIREAAECHVHLDGYGVPRVIGGGGTLTLWERILYLVEEMGGCIDTPCCPNRWTIATSDAKENP